MTSILLLARSVSLEYRVLRCAAATGATVHVLGQKEARDLSLSRYSASFHEADGPISAGSGGVLLDQINRLTGEHDIDVILPTDGETTALIANHRSRIASPCFPGPTVETFARLNNKWRMMQLCAELGLPHPQSRLIARDELAARYRAGTLSVPCVAKPVDMFGGVGVKTLCADQLEQQVHAIDYDPVILQTFIPGQDVCISAFCRRGEVVAEVIYTKHRGQFSFIANPTLSECVRRISAYFNYDGVLQLDARVDVAGATSLIECNPRFWYNMDIAMIAGVNFVELGLQEIGAGAGSNAPSNGFAARAVETAWASHEAGAPSRPAFSWTNVANLRGLLAKMIRPWTFASADLRTLSYYMTDPIASTYLDRPRTGWR